MMEIEQFQPSDKRIEDFQDLVQRIYENPSLEQIPDDAVCVVAYQEGTPVARLSCSKDETNGMIGHYETVDKDAGIALLEYAKQILPQQQIIGPMNGSTWERYRLAIQTVPDPAPFFLGEPKNPPEYPGHFIQAGFTPIETYESRYTEQLTLNQEKAKPLRQKIEKKGITIEPADLTQFDKILEEIFHLSTSSFAENLFYHPIDFPRFKKLYEPIRPLLDPEMIQLAHTKEGKLAGFLFGYPDPYNKQVIFKTLAVIPEVRGTGLGVYLFDLLHLIAHQKGYTRVVHALMHSENVSIAMSTKRYQSQPLREYILYHWNR